MRRIVTLLAFLALLAPPHAVGGVRRLGTLTIGSIGLKAAFYPGTVDSVLQYGPGHYAGTSMPGQGGVVGIAGHRVTRTHPFRFLDDVKSGDVISVLMVRSPVRSGQRFFRYRVGRVVTVSVDDTRLLKPRVPWEQLVLTTCTPPGTANFRLVVVANRF